MQRIEGLEPAVLQTGRLIGARYLLIRGGRAGTGRIAADHQAAIGEGIAVDTGGRMAQPAGGAAIDNVKQENSARWVVPWSYHGRLKLYIESGLIV